MDVERAFRLVRKEEGRVEDWNECRGGLGSICLFFVSFRFVSFFCYIFLFFFSLLFFSPPR